MNFGTLTRFSDPLFNWVVDMMADDNAYYLTNQPDYILNMVFVVLLVCSVGAVLTFYYGIAAKAENATYKNLFTIFLLGILVLVLATLVCALRSGYSDCYSYMNFWKVILVDVCYYAVLFEVIAWLVKTGSNAKHLSILGYFTNK